MAKVVAYRRIEIRHCAEPGTVLHQHAFDGMIGKPFPVKGPGGATRPVTAGTLVAASVAADGGSVKLTINFDLNFDRGISEAEVSNWGLDPFGLGRGSTAIELHSWRTASRINALRAGTSRDTR